MRTIGGLGRGGRKIGWLIGLFLWLPLLMADQDKPSKETVSLSLNDCIGLALRNNMDIEVSRYQPAIDEASVLTASGPFDTLLTAEAGGGEKIYQSPFSFSGAAVTDEDRLHTALGIKQKIHQGASFDLSLANDRAITSNPAYDPDPRWEQSVGLTITVPVLKGAGESANMSTYLISGYTHEGSIRQFEKSLADSLFEVTKAYWELAFAVESVKVKQQTLQVAERLLEENRKKFEVGQIAKIEVIQAEAGMALQQEGILTAENAVQNATDQLKRLIDPAWLNRDMHDVTVELKDPPRSFEKEMDIASVLTGALKDALAKRPELEQYRQRIMSGEAALAKAENDLKPKLDVTTKTSLSGINSNMGNTFDETTSGDYRELSGLLQFEVPLGNYAAQGSFSKATLEKRKAEMVLRQAELGVVVEVRKAVREIKTAEKRIMAAKKAVELAKEQLDAEQKKLGAGLTTTFMVLDIQKDYAEARKNEIRALIDYNIALVDLQRATGTMLEKNSVVLKDQLQIGREPEPSPAR